MISHLEGLGYDQDKDTLLQLTVVIKGGDECTTSYMIQGLFNNLSGRDNLRTDLNVTRPKEKN